MISSILAITNNDLPFDTLGGKYPRLGLKQLGHFHARHTKRQKEDRQIVEAAGLDITPERGIL